MHAGVPGSSDEEHGRDTHRAERQRGADEDKCSADDISRLAGGMIGSGGAPRTGLAVLYFERRSV